MANWSTEPALTQTWANFLASLKERDDHLAKMDFTGDTNLSTGFIRWNNGTGVFERWNGSSWDTLPVANTSNVVPTSRTLTASTGLSGGGDLSTNRSFSLANMTQATVKGRASGAGTGAPGDLTGAQVATIIGLASLAYKSTINNADWNGADLAVANGGTGGSDAATARANLGAQASSSLLSAIASLSPSDGYFIVGSGATWVREAGSVARTSLGLGALAVLSSINNSQWSGTDLAVANGGTGASTASAARANLGIIETEYKTKASDEEKTNDPNLANDSVLAGFTVAPDTVYLVQAHLNAWESTLGGNPGIRYGFNFSQVPQNYGVYSFAGVNPDSLGFLDPDAASPYVIIALTAGNEQAIIVRGVFKSHATVAGTLSLQWCQGSSSATPVRNRAMSSMWLTPIG